jgi:hypothetical protein
MSKIDKMVELLHGKHLTIADRFDNAHCWQHEDEMLDIGTTNLSSSRLFAVAYAHWEKHLRRSPQ